MKRFKFIICIFLCIFALTINVTLINADNQCYIESPWVFTIENNSANIVGYIGEDTECKVPWNLGDLEVKKIEKDAFKGTNIIKATIPTNVDSIGVNENVDFNTYDLSDIIRRESDVKEEDDEGIVEPIIEPETKEENPSEKKDEQIDKKDEQTNSNLINTPNSYKNETYSNEIFSESSDNIVVNENPEVIFEERQDNPFDDEEVFELPLNNTEKSTINILLIVISSCLIMSVFGFIIFKKFVLPLLNKNKFL